MPLVLLTLYLCPAIQQLLDASTPYTVSVYVNKLSHLTFQHRLEQTVSCHLETE